MADQNRGKMIGFTDKDYIEAFGLDPSLEGKPGINKAIRDAVRDQTKRAYMAEGMDEAMATKLAMKHVK